MAFENLRDQISESVETLKARVTESEAYNRCREYYYTLPSRQQNLVKIGAVLIIVLLLINIPFGNLKEANYNMDKYRERKNVVGALKSVEKKKTSVSFNPSQFNLSQLRMDLETRLLSVPVSKDQISLQETSPIQGVFPSQAQVQTYELDLNKLNLRQLTNTLKIVENLSDSVLVTGLTTQSNNDDPHYHNLKVYISNFYMQEAAKTSKKPKGRGRR